MGLEFRKVLEGFRKLVSEGCLEFVYFARGPEGSGRFPEACPEACFESSHFCIPEGFRDRDGKGSRKLCVAACPRKQRNPIEGFPESEM